LIGNGSLKPVSTEMGKLLDIRFIQTLISGHAMVVCLLASSYEVDT
jgi:hypothetical protein